MECDRAGCKAKAVAEIRLISQVKEVGELAITVHRCQEHIEELRRLGKI